MGRDNNCEKEEIYYLTNHSYQKNAIWDSIYSYYSYFEEFNGLSLAWYWITCLFFRSYCTYVHNCIHCHVIQLNKIPTYEMHVRFMKIRANLTRVQLKLIFVALKNITNFIVSKVFTVWIVLHLFVFFNIILFRLNILIKIVMLLYYYHYHYQYACSQFHQHFTNSFCANFSFVINYKFTLWLEKSFEKHLSAKNVKSWWNWHLVVSRIKGQTLLISQKSITIQSLLPILNTLGTLWKDNPGIFLQCTVEAVICDHFGQDQSDTINRVMTTTVEIYVWIHRKTGHWNLITSSGW